MRLIIFLFLMINITAFCQDEQYDDWILNRRLPKWAAKSLTELKITENYKISDYINPFYLEADFNSDGKQDIAISVEEIRTNKKGFIIIHNSNNDFYVFGAGSTFGNGGDNYNWMDIWNVQHDLNTYELTFKEDGDIDDSKELKLKSPGINVVKSESAGGLIYWDGEKYLWAQTSD